MLVKKTVWAALAAATCVSSAGAPAARGEDLAPNGLPRIEVRRPAPPTPAPALVPVAEPPKLEAAAPKPVAAPAPVPQAAPAKPKETLQIEAVQERYPNRRIKLERHVILDAKQNFVNHGLWTMWDPNGEMLGTGEYRFGQRHGRWLRWYPPAVQAESGDSVTPLFDGPAEAAEGGEIAQEIENDAFAGEEYAGFTRPFVSEAVFENGVLNGEWTVLDADGRKVNAWPFENDKLHGKAVTYYPDGRERSSIDFVHGVIHGDWIEWDEKGKVTRTEKYMDGCHKAPAVEYHANGKKKSEGTLLYAREYADATHDWWNGVIEMDVVEKPGANKRFGLWNYWYENGGLRATGEYVEDLPVGPHTWFYENGQKQVVGAFIQGKREGHWTFWHQNGLRQSEGDFAGGVPVGHWRKWNADGTLLDLRDYASGTSVRQMPTPAASQPIRRGPTAARSQTTR